jgi:structural maintenance of chromosomes protein 5
VVEVNNPQALEEYEKWSRRIEQEQADHKAKEERLLEVTERMTTLRGQWEPRVDELVERINEAFSYNFEQISCAGEVGVHKEEDFAKWAIEIKVRFR